MTIEKRDIVDEDEWLEWRMHDVTASAAAALLGIHPYQTVYSLWADKTGLTPRAEMTPAMERGKELEPLAARRLHKLHPNWHLEAAHVYYRMPEVRLGATPDLFAWDPDRAGLGVIQVKSVTPGAFARTWRQNGEVEVPMWIVVQAAVEAELTGASWCAVACLVVDYGIELHLVEVPLVADLITRIKTEVADFWRMVDAGKTPDPDYGRDSDLIAKLYTPSGKMIDLAQDNQIMALCDERLALNADKAAIVARQGEIKAQILAKLGGASGAVLNDGRVVTATLVNRKAYTVKPTTFLDLRIRQPKEATP